MAFGETIRLTIDVLNNSKSSLGQLKSDLKNADTAFGKTKVAGAALGDFLKTTLAFSAAGAGTAIAGFGIKAAKAFTETGVAVGKFRDATGLAAEDASRFLEASGDLGISVEVMSTALGRLNRAAATTPQAFEDIGVAIRHSKDGTIDVKETFLATIDALNEIPSASDRAAAAQKIFGRGWQQIAELVGGGAQRLRAQLDDVGDAQIFDDDQIAKAREMRDRLEELQDKFASFELTVGGWVVTFADALEEDAESLGKVYTQAKRLFTLQDLRNSVLGSGEIVASTTKNLGELTREIGEVQGPVKATARHLFKMVQAYREAGQAADIVDGQFVSGADAMRGLDSAAHDVGQSASDFESRLQSAAGAEQRLESDARAASQALHDLRTEVENSLSSTFDYESNTLALGNAVRDISSRIDDYNTMLAENNDNIDDNNHSAGEMADALTGVRQAQISAAQQALATAQSFADQSGAVQGTSKHTRLMKEELNRLADANPAIRGEIQQYIDKLKKIPPNANTQARLDKEEAEAAAERYDKRVRAITKEVNSKTNLDTGDAMDAANAFEQRAEDVARPYEASISLSTGDAFAAANAFEARLNSIQDENVNITTTTTNVVNTVQHAIGFGPGTGDATGGMEMSGTLVGEHGPEFVQFSGGTARVIPAGSGTNAALARAGTLASRADVLYKQAAALRELAKASDNAKRKEELRAEAEKKTEQADKALANSVSLAEAARDRHVAAIQRETEAMRANAERTRENTQARSEALSEQAASVRESVDAESALTRAQFAARDATRAATEAHRTFGLSQEQRTLTDLDARDAVLALADAQVTLARETAEAQGHTLSAAQETSIRQRQVQRQLASASPELRGVFSDLLGDLQSGKVIDLQRRAEDVAAKGEKSAKTLDQAANTFDRAANKLSGRNLERLLKTLVRAEGTMSRKQIERALRRVAA